MQRDDLLAELLTVTDDEMSVLIADPSASLDPDDEVRAKRYMDDLRAVLATPEGIRVLRVWLECAGLHSPVFCTNSNIYRQAALRDYAQERFGEIIASDPKGGLKILLEGAREAATKDIKGA